MSTTAPAKRDGIHITTAADAYTSFVNDFQKSSLHAEPQVRIARKFTDHWPFTKDGSDQKRPSAISIAVLDSSFNPPHYCHGAYLETFATQKATQHSHSRPSVKLPIDAYLLLLGSTNADKALTGATLSERMFMVDMLATTISHDMTSDTWHVWKDKESEFYLSHLDNIAIGMVNVPKFIDKVRAVSNLVRESAQRELEVTVYFAMGWDTLLRFFDPKFYADDESMERAMERFFVTEGGRIVFAQRRGFSDENCGFWDRKCVRRFAEFIYEIELPKRVQDVSSTEVRRAVKESSGRVRDVPPRVLEFINKYQLYR